MRVKLKRRADLIRLERYEQQAYNRLLRSMRKFANSKWSYHLPKLVY